MSALHEVLRYLHSRVPASTQDEHDQIAAYIEAVPHIHADEAENAVQPAQAKKERKP